MPLKRVLFLLVVNTIAFLAGVYVAPLGIDRLVGALFFTTVLAIRWMRTY